MVTGRKKNETPIIAIVGFSGSGKTTLLEKLIPVLRELGFRVGTIKHHFHDFEMDKPGKDSWRHKQAGAAVSVVSSPGQIGMVRNVDHDHEPQDLCYLFTGVDVILAEGYKRGSHSKIEVFRAEVSGKQLLCHENEGLVAVVSDENPKTDAPVFRVDDTDGIAARIAGIIARDGCKSEITANPG